MHAETDRRPHHEWHRRVVARLAEVVRAHLLLEGQRQRHYKADTERTGLDDPGGTEGRRVRWSQHPVEKYRRDDEMGHRIAEQPLLATRPEGVPERAARRGASTSAQDRRPRASGR